MAVSLPPSSVTLNDAASFIDPSRQPDDQSIDSQNAEELARTASLKGDPKAQRMGKGSQAAVGTEQGATSVATPTPLFGKDALASLSPELLQSLAVLGQLTQEVPGQSVNSVGLDAMQKLVALMGKPNGLPVSEAYQREWLPEAANYLVNVSAAASNVLVGLALRSDDLGTLARQGLSELEQVQPSGGSADLPSALRKFTKLAEVVQNTFFKAEQADPKALLQNVPASVLKAFEQALPQITAALKPLYLNPDGTPVQFPTIELPAPAIAKLEASMATPLAVYGDLCRRLQTVDTNSLKQAFEAIKSGDTSKVPPEVLALAKDVLNQSAVSGVSAKGSRPALEGGAAAKASAATEGAAAAGAAVITVGAGTLGGGASGATMLPGTGDYALKLIDTGDIESLIYWVMMEGTKVEESLLRDSMKEMQIRNNQKKAMREKMQVFKEGEAATKKAMSGEFNQLVSEGIIDPSWTIADYEAWRTVAWGDGTMDNGKFSGPSPQLGEIGEIPAYFKKSKTAKAETIGSGAPSGADAAAAAKYGLSDEGQISALRQLYDTLAGGEKAMKYLSFDDFLKQAVGLKPASSMADVAANTNKLISYLQGAKAGDQPIVNKYDVPGAVWSTDAGASAANLGSLEGWIAQEEVLEALKSSLPSAYRSAVDVQINDLKTKINGVLNAPGKLTEDDAVKLQKWQSATGPDSLQGKMDEAIKQFSSYVDECAQYNTTMQNKAAAGAYAHLHVTTETNWGAGGPEVTFHKRDSSSSDENNDLTVGYGGSVTMRDDSSDNEDHVDVNQHPEQGQFPEAGGIFGALNAIAGADGTIPWSAISAAATGMARQGGPVDWKYPPGAPDMTKDLDPTPAHFGSDVYDGIIGSAQGTADQIAAIQKLWADPSIKNEKGEIPTDLLKGYDQTLVQSLIDKGYIKTGKSQEELDNDKFNQAHGIQSATGGQGSLVGHEDPNNAATYLSTTDGTIAGLDAKIDSLKGDLDSMSEQSELDSMRMQAQMDRRQKLLEALSNIMKKLSSTSETLISNMK